MPRRTRRPRPLGRPTRRASRLAVAAWAGVVLASTLRFAWYVLSADGPRDSWLMLTGMGAVVVLSVGFVRRSPATIAAGLGFSFLTPSLVIWYVWPLLIAGVIGFATQAWHQHTSTR